MKKTNRSRNLICNKCNRKYLFETDSKKGHTLKYCNSCNVNFRRFALKSKAIEYGGGKCKRCGYKNPVALDFHHIDPLTKRFTIAGNHTRSWESLSRELDKCILLCSNCHRETHQEMVG